MTDSSFPTESSIKEVTAPEYLCITEDIQPKGMESKISKPLIIGCKQTVVKAEYNQVPQILETAFV